MTINPLKIVINATIIVSILVSSDAFGAEPCDPSSDQQAIQQERAAAAAKSCDRSSILSGFIGSMKQTVESANHSQDFLDLGAGKVSYERGLQRTTNAIAALEQKGANDSTIAGLVGLVRQEAQAFMAPLITKPLDELDDAGVVPVCDAKLDWRRSKIWKEALDECPIETPATPPPSNGEADQPSNDDGPDEDVTQ